VRRSTNNERADEKQVGNKQTTIRNKGPWNFLPLVVRRGA